MGLYLPEPTYIIYLFICCDNRKLIANGRFQLAEITVNKTNQEFTRKILYFSKWNQLLYSFQTPKPTNKTKSKRDAKLSKFLKNSYNDILLIWNVTTLEILWLGPFVEHKFTSTYGKHVIDLVVIHEAATTPVSFKIEFP